MMTVNNARINATLNPRLSGCCAIFPLSWQRPTPDFRGEEQQRCMNYFTLGSTIGATRTADHEVTTVAVRVSVPRGPLARHAHATTETFRIRLKGEYAEGGICRDGRRTKVAMFVAKAAAGMSVSRRRQ
jgi:hypothetical protein